MAAAFAPDLVYRVGLLLDAKPVLADLLARMRPLSRALTVNHPHYSTLLLLRLLLLGLAIAAELRGQNNYDISKGDYSYHHGASF
jgi:hypothetical protein